VAGATAFTGGKGGTENFPPEGVGEGKTTWAFGSVGGGIAGVRLMLSM